MNKQNKAPQATKGPVMVDVTKLHTPTGYAKLMGQSRANIYLLINNGNIPPERVFKVDGQMLILEGEKK